MSKSPISNLNFAYMNTSERRVLNLEPAGLPEIPMLGYCQYRNPRPDVPLHWHPGCIEIHYGVRNALTFGFNHRLYRLGPGDVFVSLPGEHHTVSAHPKGLILYWLIVRMEQEPFLRQPPEEAAALRQALLHIPHRLFRGTATIKRLFQSLHMLADEPATPLRALRLRTATLELLLETLSAAREHQVPADQSRLESLLDLIRNHPEQPHPVDDLARRAGLAPNHFITRFRLLTGLPPRQFLLDCRMQAARRLLREADCPITEIALRLGFCSSQHFASLFKRHTGVTPLAYRSGLAGPSRTSDREDGQGT